MWRYDVKGRLWFQPITEDDAYQVCEWRNTSEARRMFYSQEAVTPDTHIMFMRNRKPHDLIWMIYGKLMSAPIGMTSLTVDVKNYTAEYGRAFVAPGFRGRGFGQEQEYMVLSLAFGLFNLHYLWGDVLVHNEAALDLHHKTGWTDVGINVEGHTNIAGPVMHIEYPSSRWSTYRQKFIDEFGVTL